MNKHGLVSAEHLMDEQQQLLDKREHLLDLSYQYQAPEASDAILSRIIGLENEIAASLHNLFSKEG